MNTWNRLLKSLDDALGFPNKLASTVKKTHQFYDAKKSEHVFVLEYRVKVVPGKHRSRLIDGLVSRWF